MYGDYNLENYQIVATEITSQLRSGPLIGILF